MFVRERRPDVSKTPRIITRTGKCVGRFSFLSSRVGVGRPAVAGLKGGRKGSYDGRTRSARSYVDAVRSIAEVRFVVANPPFAMIRTFERLRRRLGWGQLR